MEVHTEECEQVGVRGEVTGGGAKMSRTGEAAVEFGGGYEAGDGYDGREVQTEVWNCAPECPVRMLDEQTADKIHGAGHARTGEEAKVSASYDASAYEMGQHRLMPRYGDKGGASRFFYNAKASKSERNAGLPDGMKNTHPTVKPVALMRWLVRMVTPPDGILLDPFMGSGTTGVAAVQEGLRFVGVDLDEDGNYLTIARHRIRHAGANRVRVLRKKQKKGGDDGDDG